MEIEAAPIPEKSMNRAFRMVKGNSPLKTLKEILGFTKVISKTVISKGRGVPYGRMTMKNNPATIQMIV